MAIYKIDWLERRKTPTGKDVISASLRSSDGIVHDKVSIWGDFPNWASLMSGNDVSGEIKANPKGYKTLYPEMTKGFNRAPSGAVKAAEITRDSVKVAQEKKNESISYFNSLNAAINLVTNMPIYQNDDAGDLRNSIAQWRDYFLEEWKKYEAQDPNDKHKPF